MKGSDLLLHLLSIEKSFWKVIDIKMDVSHKRLHLWLTSTDNVDTKDSDYEDSQVCEVCAIQSGFQWEDRNVSLFHIGLGGYGTKLHTKVRVYKTSCQRDDCGSRKAILGPVDLGVTELLAYSVVELLSKGAAYSSVCNLFNIPLQTVWAIKRKFDSGSLTFRTSDASAMAKSLDGVKQADKDDLRPLLPHVDNKAWDWLLSRDNGFKTRSLSLKFMLSKIRKQVNNVKDDEYRRIKVGELRHFFEKHQRVLAKEIAQLDDRVKTA